MRRPITYREIPGERETRLASRRSAAVSGAIAAATPTRSDVPLDPSFERDIRPMFAPFASAMMWRFDLTNYEAVMANSQTISQRISQAGKPS